MDMLEARHWLVRDTPVLAIGSVKAGRTGDVCSRFLHGRCSGFVAAKACLGFAFYCVLIETWIPRHSWLEAGLRAPDQRTPWSLARSGM